MAWLTLLISRMSGAEAPTYENLIGKEPTEMAMIGQNTLVAQSRQFYDITEQTIWEMAEKYGIEYDLLYNLMICESQGKADAVGDNSKAFGLYQWHLGSWNMYSKIFYNMFSRTLERDYWRDQMEMTAWVLSLGESDNWYRCMRKI